MPVKTWKQIKRNQQGTALYFVVALLTILLTSASVATSVAAIENSKTRGQSLSDILVLEVAKLCQNQANGCNATTIDADLKANPEFKALLASNNVLPSEITISDLGSETTNRSRVTVTLTKSLYVPLAGIIGRSNQSTVISKARASWTNYSSITNFSRGDYLPLFINDCVFPELTNPTTTGYNYLDNQKCSNVDEPKLWWFGNAGQSQTSGGNTIPACYKNNAGPTLQVGDKINNSSSQAMPANDDCQVNVSYLVPYFKKYTPAGPLTRTVSTTTYEKVWTVFSQAQIKKGSNVRTVDPGVTQTYTKTCQTSTDGFTSSNCVNKSGSPTPNSGATCVGITLSGGESCSVVTSPDVLLSTTPKTTTTTYYVYSKTWTVFSQAVVTNNKGAKRLISPGVTQTYVKTCDNSTDAFDAASCVTDVGYPNPSAGATCVGVSVTGGESCAVVTNVPVWVSTTQKTTTPYGTVAGFMKVKLLSIYFDSTTATNAQPNHQYRLAYAGQDIRLIPN